MTKKQRRRVWGSVTEMRRGKKYVLRWMQNTPQGRRRKTKTCLLYTSPSPRDTR